MLKKTIGMGGFTLAEVLITLGIIGVVAAMTMPTLINSTQGAQYKTGFKKALTVLSQAVVMNIALNDYDLSQVVAGTNTAAAGTGTDGSSTPATIVGGPQSLYDLFSNRLNIVRTAAGSDFDATAGSSNQWLIVSDTDSNDRTTYKTNHCEAGCTNNYPGFTINGKWADNATIIMMNDGISFIFDNTQDTCQKANTDIGVAKDSYCFGFIDVNGQKAPNRVVQCDGAGGADAANRPDGSDDFACTVSNPTDIYPIALYDQSVIPASAAARAVLYNK